MIKMTLLLGGVAGLYYFWPEVQADDRLMWAGLIPAVYLVGMWALSDGKS